MHGLLRRWDVPPPSKPELGETSTWHFDLDKAGDIDIVIVCKKLNKSYFKKKI